MTQKQIEAAMALEKAHREQDISHVQVLKRQSNRQRDKPMTVWDWCVAWMVVAIMMAVVFLPAFL